MSMKHCSGNKPVPEVNVTVTVDVPKIVKYSCLTGVLIVGIIFTAKCFLKTLEKDILPMKNNKG